MKPYTLFACLYAALRAVSSLPTCSGDFPYVMASTNQANTYSFDAMDYSTVTNQLCIVGSTNDFLAYSPMLTSSQNMPMLSVFSMNPLNLQWSKIYSGITPYPAISTRFSMDATLIVAMFQDGGLIITNSNNGQVVNYFSLINYQGPAGISQFTTFSQKSLLLTSSSPQTVIAAFNQMIGSAVNYVTLMSIQVFTGSPMYTFHTTNNLIQFYGIVFAESDQFFYTLSTYSGNFTSIARMNSNTGAIAWNQQIGINPLQVLGVLQFKKLSSNSEVIYTVIYQTAHPITIIQIMLSGGNKISTQGIFVQSDSLSFIQGLPSNHIDIFITDQNNLSVLSTDSYFFFITTINITASTIQVSQITSGANNKNFYFGILVTSSTYISIASDSFVNLINGYRIPIRQSNVQNGIILSNDQSKTCIGYTLQQQGSTALMAGVLSFIASSVFISVQSQPISQISLSNIQVATLYQPRLYFAGTQFCQKTTISINTAADQAIIQSPILIYSQPNVIFSYPEFQVQQFCSNATTTDMTINYTYSLDSSTLGSSPVAYGISAFSIIYIHIYLYHAAYQGINSNFKDKLTIYGTLSNGIQGFFTKQFTYVATGCPSANFQAGQQISTATSVSQQYNIPTQPSSISTTLNNNYYIPYVTFIAPSRINILLTQYSQTGLFYEIIYLCFSQNIGPVVVQCCNYPITIYPINPAAFADPLVNQTLFVQSQLIYTLPNYGVGCTDTITIETTEQGQSTLPSFIQYFQANLSFVISPSFYDAGSYAIEVNLIDGALVAPYQFWVNVVYPDIPPSFVGGSPQDQIVYINQFAQYTLPSNKRIEIKKYQLEVNINTININNMFNKDFCLVKNILFYVWYKTIHAVNLQVKRSEATKTARSNKQVNNHVNHWEIAAVDVGPLKGTVSSFCREELHQYLMIPHAMLVYEVGTRN